MIVDGGQGLADSRGMMLSELPGSGLGLQGVVTLYPLHWKAVTFGVGGEVIVSRSRQSPDAETARCPSAVTATP